LIIEKPSFVFVEISRLQHTRPSDYLVHVFVNSACSDNLRCARFSIQNCVNVVGARTWQSSLEAFPWLMDTLSGFLVLKAFITSESTPTEIMHRVRVVHFAEQSTSVIRNLKSHGSKWMKKKRKEMTCSLFHTQREIVIFKILAMAFNVWNDNLETMRRLSDF